MNTAYVYEGAQVGEFRNSLLWAAGPASYSLTNGDPVYNPGAAEYINFPSDCSTKSGSYRVRFFPLAVGLGQIRAGAPSPSQSGWLARWYYGPTANGITGASFTAGSGYPNGTYVLTANSGSATITVVVSGGAITSAYVSNPGSGYSTLPTFALTPIEGVVIVQNAAGISMTAASGTQAPMTFAGGNGTGAAGYITVTGATTCTITVTNAGTGYTSAPTATVSNTITGGTAPTLTVSVGSTAAVAATGLGPAAEQEVGNGTNLSAELIQFMALESQL